MPVLPILRKEGQKVAPGGWVSTGRDLSRHYSAQALRASPVSHSCFQFFAKLSSPCWPSWMSPDSAAFRWVLCAQEFFQFLGKSSPLFLHEYILSIFTTLLLYCSVRSCGHPVEDVPTVQRRTRMPRCDKECGRTFLPHCAVLSAIPASTHRSAN